MNWKHLTIAPDQTHHIDRHNGTPAYPQRFNEVLAFHKPGLAPVHTKDGSYHIDSTGNAFYTQRFVRCFGFYDGLATVVTSKGWRHILPNGTFAHGHVFTWSGNFQDGICTIRTERGKYLHVDKNGRPLYEQEWNYAGDFRYGIGVVQNSKGYSTHITKEGHFIHQQWFLDLDVFHKGYARAEDQEGWMHINKEGASIYPQRYAMVEPYYNGQARVKTKEGALLIIDEKGEVRTEIRKPQIDHFSELSRDMVGFWKTQTIATAVQFGVFEILPNTIEQIAKQTRSNPFYMNRLLRALGELKITTLEKDIWYLTDRGRLLRTDHPKTLASASLEYAEYFYHRWSTLYPVLKSTDKPQSKDIFTEVSHDKNRVKRHTKMLESYAKHDYEQLVSYFNLKGNEQIIDVGGGSGTLATFIQKRHPNTNITILERPEIIQESVKNIRWVEQDIFQPWAMTADIIIFSRIFHDWNDEKVFTLLQHTRTALRQGGRFFIVEMLLNHHDFGGSLCDIHLLLTSHGMERSKKHYISLIRQAGLKYEKTHTTKALPSIIEAHKGSLLPPLRYRIPHSVHSSLQIIPNDRPVLFLLRHSVREKLDSDYRKAFVQPITTRGKEIAYELGTLIGERLSSLQSSPLVRCIDTATYLQLGTNQNKEIVRNHLLGDPGPFVIDSQAAGITWKNNTPNEIMASLFSREEPLCGLARGHEATEMSLIRFMHSIYDNIGIHVFCTHDSIIAGFISYFLDQVLEEKSWPLYLEGAFFWLEEQNIIMLFREKKIRLPWPPLLLTTNSIEEYAKREIAQTIGLDSSAHFYAAGGMFKTLITGKEARDIDIWAASERDKQILIEHLLQKGAIEQPDKKYQRIFLIGQKTIEIANSLHATSLEERLKRFDIGLSGIGVEFYSDGKTRGIIRPEATTSLLAKEIHLIYPLISTKHCLTTIERMERYAKELDFSMNEAEVRTLWEKIFAEEYGSNTWSELIQMYNDTTHSDAYLIKDLETEEDWNLKREQYRIPNKN